MEFAGYICDTCLTRARNIAEQHPNLVFIPFIKETAGPDGSSLASFEGGSLVAEIILKDDNGQEQRALMIRGFNPSGAILKKVKASQIFEHFLTYLSGVAAADGISTIVVPRDDTWGVALTNRPFVFELIRTRYVDSGAPIYRVVSVEAAHINDVPVHEVVAVWQGHTRG